MNVDRHEMLIDLLAKKAISGLDDAEQQQLEDLGTGTIELEEFRSLEITAAAISMVGLETDEPLPSHLYSKIAADAQQYVGAAKTEIDEPWPAVTSRTYEADDIFTDKPSRSFFGWFGWTVAAAACIALALNIWFTRVPAAEQVQAPPVETPQIKTMAQMRDEFMRSGANMTRANWAAGNVKELKQVTGDIVWSDEKQAGYMRFQGLPVNDAAATCYQLWIFDKTQDKTTPIDGGTFDVTAEGEIIIPINAKLKAQSPEMFAVTIERHGGVVVSKREKIAAIAKVETQAS